MPPISRSIVLRDRGPCEDLRQRVEEVVRTFKSALDLFFVHEQRIERAPGVVVHVWWEPHHPKMDIRLACDDELGARYVNVTAPDPNLQQRVLDALAAQLPFVPLEELRERARHDNSEQVWQQLAIGVREDFDLPTYDLIVDALSSPNSRRRRSAAHAAALLAWPILTSPLEQAVTRETDESTRSVLAIAAKETARGKELE